MRRSLEDAFETPTQSLANYIDEDEDQKSQDIDTMAFVGGAVGELLYLHLALLAPDFDRAALFNILNTRIRTFAELLPVRDSPYLIEARDELLNLAETMRNDVERFGLLEPLDKNESPS